MVNAREEEFEVVMVDDVIALFTIGRVDRESVPKNLYCYDARGDDDGQGKVCEIAPFISVNHWGTIITKEELPMEEGSYYPEYDLNYIGEEMTLEQFEQTTFNEFGEPMDENSQTDKGEMICQC